MTSAPQMPAMVTSEDGNAVDSLRVESAELDVPVIYSASAEDV